MANRPTPKAVDAATISACACFQVRTAARTITDFYDESLAPSGLRITQFAILATIERLGQVTMNELAGDLGLDASTMTRTVGPLESAGLVSVKPAASDKRIRELVLTAKGRRKLAGCSEQWKAAQEGLRQRIGSGRFNRLIEDMGAVTTALRERR